MSKAPVSRPSIGNSGGISNFSGDDIDYPYCQDLNTKYEKLLKIGEGTFGEVFKARDRKTGKLVALKKVRMENEKEGFPITAIREIRILQVLKHENVMPLLEICRYRYPNRKQIAFYLVCDFCEHDMAGLLSNKGVKFSLSNKKCFMKQLLEGLFYMHTNQILHRDMKAANILITKEGKVKLADFGLARAFSIPAANKPNRYTNRVVTLWYRPPELLLGERNYGPPIDIWGAGCIMAEMWTRNPIMQGTSEQHQLDLITNLCGNIDASVWPNVDTLPLYSTLNVQTDRKRRVKDRMRAYMAGEGTSLDLIDKLLTLDPSQRMSADSALNHDFFWTDPMPSEEEFKKMLSQHTKSMFEFLAPPRRGGMVFHGGQGRGAGPSAAGSGQPAHSNKPQLQDTAHFDRVF